MPLAFPQSAGKGSGPLMKGLMQAHPGRMGKFVLCSIPRTLGSGDDDGSVVLCDDHLKTMPFLKNTEDLIFDASSVPGGGAFECERCLDMRDHVNQGEWDYGFDCRYPKVDRWQDRRHERSADLYRLTVANQLRRLSQIAERLAEIAVLVFVILIWRWTMRAITPYLGDSWIRDLALVIMLFLVQRIGVRLLLHGRVSRRPVPVTAASGS
jgi:hypothetical protein